MKRSVAILVALISVVIASLIGVAAPRESASTTTEVPLGTVCDLRDGLSARVTDAYIAKAPSDDPGVQDVLRYLAITVEVTRTKSTGASVYVKVHAGRRTLLTGNGIPNPAAGFVSTTTVFFLMDKEDLVGAQLEITADTAFITGSFHSVYLMDLGFTSGRVAELDARAGVAERAPDEIREAVR